MSLFSTITSEEEREIALSFINHLPPFDVSKDLLGVRLVKLYDNPHRYYAYQLVTVFGQAENGRLICATTMEEKPDKFFSRHAWSDDKEIKPEDFHIFKALR
jgi:hypothetical protein